MDTDSWIDHFVEANKKNPDCLAFIPKLYNKHLQKDEYLYAFSLATPKKVKTYVVKDGKTNKISGGASIINKKLFEEIGVYDEGFFVGFEDFELGIRAIKMKKEIKALEIPSIKLIHDHRKVTADYDNDYLKVRYNRDKIKQSFDRIKELHGLELPDSGEKWAARKLESMQKDEKNNNIRVTLYTEDQVKIGGIETFNRNFCKRMSKYYDITFLCKRGDPLALQEISQYADVVFYDKQEINTDIFIYGQAWGDRPDKGINAKKYIQMVHGDYEWMKKALQFTYTKMPKVTEHVSVGKAVSEKFKKMTGYESTIIYNLLDPDTEVKPVLRLISVMRLGKEKGLERMEKMARKLKERDRKFIWHVYGSGTVKSYVDEMKSKFADIPEVVFMGVNLEPASIVADAHFLVALSDSEGFSYSIYEALQVGTPCIVTDFPSAKDQIQDGINGFILDMKLERFNKDFIEMLYLPVNDLNHKKYKWFNFEELSNEQDWIKLLGGDGKEIKNKKVKKFEMVKIKVKSAYRDIVLNKRLQIGEVIEVPSQRASDLIAKKLVKLFDN
jgi:glycosyltransferase involved in cell wall biosynthesis